MRLPLIAAAMCMVADLLSSGVSPAAAAAARPGGLEGWRPLLAARPAPLTCRVPPIRTGSAASFRAFYRGMAACADQFWSARFAAARLAYRPPAVDVTTGRDSVCGKIVTGAQYCPAQHTIVIRITRGDLRDPFRMNAAHAVAHEWGHHVQALTGVLDAQNALYQRATGAARTTLSHRLEMQAECFAGAFYASALRSIRPGITWRDWLGAVRMAEESEVHGRPRNLAYWQNQGFRGATPDACDTWNAAPAKVT
ncbi:hypothetical protein HII36_03960 [Nonomuraea sp. NN258]|uniref:neutral zinc metallopeptidase n=1 Tax=Nonomuraea antri TaxID=2730852 RepID=UPI00156A1A3B|nr:neutral zinc metallopeptidase [Nonomuraea antri]NRQ30989.1 hypothetical protein [Nonomuraea antri]